ncbi:MAG: PfkB family carbohydrate kinase, partial [Chloroflexota bacterium]
IFENVYHHGNRQQFLRSRAGDIAATTIPASWRQARVVHLGPLAQELDPVIAAEFPQALVGATPQGWLRGWDADGRVAAVPWENAAAVLARVDALVFSEQDVNYDQGLIDRYVAMARLAVVTRGSAGCVVYTAGTSCSLAAYPAREVEPTGAGDVFAGAFFLKYAETKDPCLAADWANCVASFAVEAPGTTGIPTLEQVQARFARRPLTSAPSSTGLLQP